MIGDVRAAGKRNVCRSRLDYTDGSEIIGVATLSPALADGADFVRRVKEFQREAWDALYDTYFPKMYRSLYVRIGDRDVAEELADEVVEQACRGVLRFRYRGVPFASWLYRVAHNVMGDWRRKRRRTPEVAVLVAVAGAGQTGRGGGRQGGGGGGGGGADAGAQHAHEGTAAGAAAPSHRRALGGLGGRVPFD